MNRIHHHRAHKGPIHSPMERAKRCVAVLTDAERLVLMEPTERALNRLVESIADQHDWNILAEALGMGVELIKRGICSDANSVAVITDGYLAIGEIGKRFPDTGHYAPRGTEAELITAGLERHALQLQFTTVKDLRAAHSRRQAAKARARAGMEPAITAQGARQS